MIDWERELDDAFLTYRTAFKTPISMIPYLIVYGKSFHLLVELKHKAMWALKRSYLNWEKVAHARVEDLNVIDEF